MNPLEQFIADNNLSEVTGDIKLLNKDAGFYVRVRHNTTTGQSIWLKYFNEHKNFKINVNPTSKESTDGFYINQKDKDGVLIEAFKDSLTNFKSKPASLQRGAVTI